MGSRALYSDSEETEGSMMTHLSGLCMYGLWMSHG